jgi:hypothetical protein
MATAVANRGARASKQQQQQQGSPATMAGSHSSSQAAEAAFELEETFPLNSSKTTAGNTSKPGSSSNSSSWSISSYSDPLVLESHTAFQALLLAPLVVWWVAILMGMWVYEGLPRGQKVYHVMLWFDRGLLRPAGPLVPFAVLAARAGVHWLAHRLQDDAAGVQQQQQKQRRGLRLGSLALSCLVVYSSMAVARLAIYLTHYFLLHNR